MKCTAVIVAAGQGTRLGASVPKAFLTFAGKPLFTHSLKTFDTHASITQIVVVAPEPRLEQVASIAATLPLTAPLAVVAGGSERWESVRNGVSQCTPDTEWVVVHDAARPFMTHEVIDTLLAASKNYRAAVTATEIADTVRRFEGDRAGETLDRHTLVRVGTPQLFGHRELVRGFELAASLPTPPTDEAVLMRQLGVEVGIAWGDPINFKITSPRDLALARLLVERDDTPSVSD